MVAATRFPVEPMSDGRFTIGFEIPSGVEIPDDGGRYGLDIAMSRDEALGLRDRLIELLDRALLPAGHQQLADTAAADVRTVGALFKGGR